MGSWVISLTYYLAAVSGCRCRCHHRNDSICKSKADAANASTKRSERRHTRPVKCRPLLPANYSKSKFTAFATEPKPCHGNNNLARTSGAAYTPPRPTGRLPSSCSASASAKSVTYQSNGLTYLSKVSPSSKVTNKPV
jgi:hypothetical protein